MSTVKGKIKVLGKNVAIEKVKHEAGKTKSGIYIPESVQQVYENGVVIAVGTEVDPTDVTVGDKVIVNTATGQNVKNTTVTPPIEFVVMPYHHIVAVVTDDTLEETLFHNPDTVPEME